VRDPRVSIVIVSWNTRDLLAACLASLDGNDHRVACEIVVVDNASSDGSDVMVAERFPHVYLVRNPTNIGFAAATNVGLQSAQGEYVLLLNSDTEVHSGAIDRLVEHLVGHDKVGIAAPRLLNPDGTLQPSCQRAPSALRELFHLTRLDGMLPGIYYPMNRWSLDRIRSVDVVMGACMLLRRDLLELAGRLHEGYFMYSEEVELCERVRAQGLGIDWVPDAVVMHHGGASAEPVADEMFLALYRSKALFHRRNRGPLSLLAFRAVLVVAALPRIAASVAAPLLGREASAEARRTARRYLRLLRELPTLA